MMSAGFAFAVVLSLAITEAVQLEIVKLVGLTVTSVASVLGAWVAYKNRAITRDVHRKVDRRRRAIRKDDGNTVLVEEPGTETVQDSGTDGTAGTDSQGSVS